MLLVVNAAILAAAGWELLDDPAVARRARRSPTSRSASPPPASSRISRELALIALASASCSPTSRSPSIASGLPLVLGWAVSALPFAALLGARRPGRHGRRVVDLVLGRPEGEAAGRADRILAMAGLLGQIALAALPGPRCSTRSRYGARRPGSRSRSALVAAGALAVVAWACAGSPAATWRTGLDALALAAVAHFTGLALEGAALTALAAEALALAGLARRTTTASPRGPPSPSPRSACCTRSPRSRRRTR